MSNFKLYIASSIDGYIAKSDGNLDWLTGYPNPDQLDYGYQDFYDGIDTVIMGRTTYDEIMGFGVDWPYTNCKSYVITTNKSYQLKTPNTELINEISTESIDQIQKGSNKGIWVVGGGRIISEFLNNDAIDEMIISIVPIILGDGIRLFPNKSKETNYEMINAHTFSNGLTNLHFKRKK
ncbi:MAG: riboflavin biosynthesis protein RibD [Bacteroidetes bacterium MedPE-SWsnd-G2]|nr:MAG: riboflavin biosynthesis protein RibD [Bacteroidetes bacterium MedPE-SWsnd-G2]